MNYIKTNHLSLLIIAFLVASSYFGSSAQSLGALDRTTFTNPVTFSSAVTNTADAVFNGGANGITITTSNSATSSATIGCINTYATSTATAIKMFPGPTNTSASTTFTTNGGAGGYVVWTFGSCP